MSKYHLIAFDMDGTLLDSKKTILESSIKAINEACKNGKEIAICSGRNVEAIRPFIKGTPAIRYAISCNGALVYDFSKEEIIYANAIDKKSMDQLIEIAVMEDTMLQLLNLNSNVPEKCLDIMELYHMGAYKESWKKYGMIHEDILDFYNSATEPFLKLCIYHRDPEARARTFKRIKDAGILVEAVYAEKTSIEITAIGTTKGAGLTFLCEHVGCDLRESISVGDADNDLQVLSTAGLAVAMGNSNDNVLAVADVVVADNDHDGCAEAIYKYLI